MDFISGFFENLCYTLVSLIFLFFIKKWFYNYINKHLLNPDNDYYINTKAHDKYNPFKNTNEDVAGNIEIVKFDSDLRLRIRDNKGNIKVGSVSNHLIPAIFYWRVFYRILKNQILCKLEKEYKPVFLIKTSKKLEKVLEDEFAILENNGR